MKHIMTLLLTLLLLDLFGQGSYKTLKRYTVTPSSGTLSPVDLANPPAKVYLYTGGSKVSLSQNLILTTTNTPPNDVIAEIGVFWVDSSIQLNGHTFSLFGTNVTQDFLNTHSSFLFSFYNNTSLLEAWGGVPVQDTGIQPVVSLKPGINGQHLETQGGLAVWAWDTMSISTDTLAANVINSGSINNIGGITTGSITVNNATNLNGQVMLGNTPTITPNLSTLQAALVQYGRDSLGKTPCQYWDSCKEAQYSVEVIDSSGGAGRNLYMTPHTFADSSLWKQGNGNLYPANLGLNVGIGTSTPSVSFDVETGKDILLNDSYTAYLDILNSNSTISGNASQVQFDAGTTIIIFDSIDSRINLDAGSSGHIYMAPSGSLVSVGIGIGTQLGYKLEVNGSIKADSALILASFDSVQIYATGNHVIGATYYCSDCHGAIFVTTGAIGGPITWTGSLWRRDFP